MEIVTSVSSVALSGCLPYPIGWPVATHNPVAGFELRYHAPNTVRRWLCDVTQLLSYAALLVCGANRHHGRGGVI